MICDNGLAISNLMRCRISVGILLGPVPLFILNCEMNSHISFSSVGRKSSIIEKGRGSVRKSE